MPDPTTLTDTIDIDGVRYAASRETTHAIDQALQGTKIDPEDGLNYFEIEDRYSRYDVAVTGALHRGELVYLQPAPSESFAINGDPETPIERAERIRAEYFEQRSEHVFVEDARSADIGVNANGLRAAFGMEPQEALQKGLVTHMDGEPGYYVAVPERVRQWEQAQVPVAHRDRGAEPSVGD